MAQNTQTFILVGKFEDQITPSLKKLTRTFKAFEKSLDRGMGRTFKELKKDLREFGKDLDVLGKSFGRKTARGTKGIADGIKAANEEAKLLGVNLKNAMDAGTMGRRGSIKDSIVAANEEARTLGTNLRNAMEAGGASGGQIKDGIVAAQQEARVLGEILKANALIQVGQGFGNALTAGAQSTMGILNKGVGFVGKQFRAAVQDELEDMQARGSLYGSLKKQGVFTGTSAEDQTRDYRQTKRISRINEEVIGNIVRESPVSTATISTLNRQLTDNLLPQMLKSRGIKDLGTQSEEQLTKTFGGKEGVGTELAKLYEQMATLMPSPGYARMGAMGFTQALTSGTINRQLAIFENNPVLVEALKSIDGGIQATSDIGKRIQILKKALEVASPTMMLDEMRMSVAGGMQAIQDTLTNPSVGILSMAMEVQGQGQKTFDEFKKNGAYEMKRLDFQKKWEERNGKLQTSNDKQKAKYLEEEKKFLEKLDDVLKNANTPLERIAVSLSPVLQSISGVLNAMGSVFMGPVNGAMNVLDTVFAQLKINLDNLASDLRDKKRSVAEALGRMFGEILKAIATLFDPEGAGKEAGNAIDKFFKDFAKGFASIDGQKYLDMVIKGIQTLIMKLLFNEGDVMKGLTPLGEGLGKIFLLLSAPAFVNALLVGVLPLAIQGFGGMLLKVFGGLATKAVAPVAAKLAARQAAQAAAAKTAATVTPSMYLAGAGGGVAAGGTIPGAAAAGGGGAGGGVAALASNPVTIAIAAAAALAVVAKITEPVVNKMAPKLQASASAQTAQAGKQAKAGDIGSMLAYFIKGEFMHVANDFMLGFNRVFAGLADLVVGLFSDPKKVEAGINKIFQGLWRLFTMIGHLIIGLVSSIPGLVVLIGNAIKNLFIGVANAIRNALAKIPGLGWMGTNPQTPQKPPTPGGGGQGGRRGGRRYNGRVGHTMPLDQAVAQEQANMPKGSHLVVANSSETIIPAAGGLDMGGGIKGMIDAIYRSAAQTANTMGVGFSVLTNTIKTTQTRQEQAVKLTGAQTTAAIRQSTMLSMQGDAKILSAIKAASAASGFFGGGGGALGGGKGSLGAATQLAQSMGLMVTSGFRPGSAGYHGVDRARDYSNSTGPTPQMMAFAQRMAATFGSSITELIYTPLGYSIKNGKKVPPIAAAGHYNHVHVAFGRGPGHPTLFSSANAAHAYERMMAPAGARIASVTANSSEFGGGAPVTINQNITVEGAMDPRATAEAVWSYTAKKVQELQNNSFA